MVKRDVALEANSTGENNQSWKVSCPECDEKLPDHRNLAVHCDRFHKDYEGCGQPQDYRVFTTTFNSYAEFQIWLSSESERTCSSLFRRSTSLKGNTFTLRCHRAGRYKPKQRVRTHASKKQTKNCSCYLNVRIDDAGVVGVEGCFGHIGHKLEVSLLRLSSRQELFLKDLLEKYSMDSILQRLQLEYSSKTSRLGFVDRKDLWNIAHRYHIVPVPNDGRYPEHSTYSDDEQDRSTSTVVEERDCDTSTSFAERLSEHHETDTEDSRSSEMSEASEHLSEKGDGSSLHEEHQEAVGSPGGSAPTKLVPITGTTSSQKASVSTTTASNRSEAPSVADRLSGAPPLPSISRRIVVSPRRLEPPHLISLADGQRSHGQRSSYLPSVGTIAPNERQEKLCPPRIADEYHPKQTPLPPPSRITTVSLRRLEPPHSISLTDEHRPVPNASSLPLQKRVVLITRQSEPDRARIEEEHHYCMKSLPSTSQSTIKLPVKQGQRNPRHNPNVTEGMFSELGGKYNNVDMRNEPQIEESEKTEPPPQKKVPPREELWRCKLCRRVMLRKSLFIHLQKLHNFNKEQLESVKRDIAQEMALCDDQGNCRVTCPICGEKLLNHASLAAHCERDHQNDGAEGEPQDYRLFTVTFNSREEFQKWLCDECERTATTFARRSSSDGGASFSLRCNRAGKFVPKSTWKACGTRKQAGNCSCFLNVHTNAAGLVTALGCFGHAGHKIDVALLRLTSSQEQFLRGLLEVYSMDSILDQLKMDYSPKTSKLYHVTRCDLWNIVNKYNIPTPLKGSRKKRQGSALDKKTSPKKVRNNEITEPREITYTCL
uniref:C2H2-type domain-containing protein n=1 Tax=Haemonchus contortus TaxID=6289 RepID=A0A7I5E6D3_HAECO